MESWPYPSHTAHVPQHHAPHTPPHLRPAPASARLPGPAVACRAASPAGCGRPGRPAARHPVGAGRHWGGPGIDGPMRAHVHVRVLVRASRMCTCVRAWGVWCWGQVHLLGRICDWRGWEGHFERLRELVAAGRSEGVRPV